MELFALFLLIITLAGGSTATLISRLQQFSQENPLGEEGQGSLGLQAPPGLAESPQAPPGRRRHKGKARYRSGPVLP